LSPIRAFTPVFAGYEKPITAAETVFGDSI
jgi:hypothetical protein